MKKPKEEAEVNSEVDSEDDAEEDEEELAPPSSQRRN